MAGLTDKQKAFVAEYVVDKNATKAAIRAGYSKKTARSIGEENLTKPDIQKEISTALAAQAERTKITADRVLELLGKMAFFDVRTVFTENGRLLPVSQWPEDAAAAVVAVDTTELTGALSGVVRKVKFADKRAAAVDIGKHLGMFVDRLDLSNADGTLAPTRTPREVMEEIRAQLEHGDV